MKPFITLNSLSRDELRRVKGAGIKADNGPRCARYECDLTVTCTPGCWCKPTHPDFPEGWCV